MDLAETVAGIAETALERKEVPGMSIAVARDGALLHAQGFGLAHIEQQVPAGPETVYQLGSIGKQFTAAGIMRLVEQNRLSLDDHLLRYFPQAPANWQPVQIHHLLQQTSGLREFFTIPAFREHASDLSRPIDELLEIILQEPLGYEPGRHWSYSNSNYTLLARIIEIISGMPYEDFLAEQFFRPLGLASLRHGASIPLPPREALGYFRSKEGLKPSPPENMNWARGDGGLVGDVRDLALWSQALAAGKAVSPESYRLMSHPQPTADGILPSYGFALATVPLDNKIPKIAHGGAMFGFSCFLAYYPKQQLTIAVLTNRGGFAADTVEKAIARRLFDLPDPQPRDEPLSPQDFARYLGTYEIGIAHFPLKLVGRDEELWIEMPRPGVTSRLMYQGGDSFLGASEPDAIALELESTGETAQRLRLTMGAMHWYGRRVSSTDG